MGNKPSNIFQMDRPESGGADRDEVRETSGFLDRAKEKFAQERETAKSDGPERTAAPRDAKRSGVKPSTKRKVTRGKRR